MLLKLYLFLTGYVTVMVKSGNIERFLNLCVNKSLYIRELKMKDGGIVFSIPVRDFRKIKILLQKTKSKVHILERHGVPFFIHRYRHRKTFVVSAVLACTLVYLSTLYIWDINVTGADQYTAQQMIRDIKEKYLTLGTKRKDVDCFEMEKKLRKDYDKIGWISCDIKGTQFNVIITETVSTDKIEKTGEPCDIIAIRDCTIGEIITRSGIPVVKSGDTVKKGDTLISGIVPIMGDYDALMDISYVESDGDIYGITTIPYEDSFPLHTYDKTYTGKETKKYSLFVMDACLRLPSGKKRYENYDTVTEETKLKLGRTFYLPVIFEAKVLKEYKVSPKTYSDAEAEKLAEKRLNAYIDTLKEKKVEILENNVTIEIRDGTCTASGTLTVSEPVGIRGPIDQSLAPKEENAGNTE